MANALRFSWKSGQHLQPSKGTAQVIGSGNRNLRKEMFHMLKFLKKAFWVPYENSTAYPTVEKAHQAIAEYCDNNGHTCVFSSADTVMIDGVEYEIYRGLEPGSRGNYGIKCREK